MGGKETQSQRLVIYRFFLLPHNHTHRKPPNRHQHKNQHVRATSNHCETTSTTTTHPPSHQPKRNHSTRAINIHNQSCPHNANPYTAPQSSNQPSISYVHHRNKQCKTNSNIETPTIHGPMIPWFHDFISCCAQAPPRHWMPSNIIEHHRISLNIIECHQIRKQS